jgi:hypothetical protein
MCQPLSTILSRPQTFIWADWRIYSSLRPFVHPLFISSSRSSHLSRTRDVLRPCIAFDRRGNWPARWVVRRLTKQTGHALYSDRDTTITGIWRTAEALATDRGNVTQLPKPVDSRMHLSDCDVGGRLDKCVHCSFHSQIDWRYVNIPQTIIFTSRLSLTYPLCSAIMTLEKYDCDPATA